jgi:hypothetical protein
LNVRKLDMPGFIEVVGAWPSCQSMAAGLHAPSR